MWYRFSYVLIPAALIALSFTPSKAWAQDAESSNQQDPSSATLSSEEERWAAEDEPSQLEPEKKPPSEEIKIPADVALALRSGYGIAGGKFAEGGSDVSDAIAGQVAFQLDAGALFNSGVYIGAYVQYGFGLLGSAIGDACDEAERLYPGTEVGCSAFDIRAGIAFEYHVGAGKKRKSVDPWVGIGTGFEYVSWKFAAQDAVSAATLTQSASGFEFASGHFGVDFAIAEWFALGPYVSATLGSYGSVDQSCEGDCEGVVTWSGPIADQSFHTWALFGAHALFQIASP